MAKRGQRRFTGAEKISREEIEKIAEEGMNPAATPKKKKKKELAVPFSMRIPRAIYDRLEQVTDETGLTKASIILRGLVSELDGLEKK
ncbi:MAG: hypothetical protein AAF806_23145 [Bacteroidota bacterium]